MNRTLVLALLVVTAARGARAQTDTTPPRVASAGFTDGLVRYGRWVTAAGALALTLLSVQQHERAEDHWDQLNRICRYDNAACVVGADGRYVNPTAETEYQATLDYDRRARRRLVGGQIALAVTVGLFIIDVGRGGAGPGNIPLAPLEVTVGGDGARIGVKVAW